MGDDEVGEFALFFDGAGVASPHDFLHGSVIIRAGNRLDIVFAIVLFAGFAFLEDHAGSHGIRARDVRVVEAFNAQRHPFKAEGILDFFHQADAFLFRVKFLGLFEAVELVLFYVEDG